MLNTIGDNYFAVHPENILGRITTRTNKFGDNVQHVKGTQEDIDRALTHVVAWQPYDFEKLASVEVNPETEKQVIEAEQKAYTKRKPASSKDTDEVFFDFSFGSEQWKRINPNISREELEAFLYAHPEIDSKKFLPDGFKFKSEHLIKGGLLFYINRRFEYLYEYITGNLAHKRSRLRMRESQDAEHIRLEYGESVLENQLAVLAKHMPPVKKITKETDTLFMLPHAHLAKVFQVSELNSGKVTVKAKGESQYKEVEKANLNEAYRHYLKNVLKANDFKTSTANDIIEFYLDNKRKTSDRYEADSKEAKILAITTKQKAKADGDRLFMQMLNDELTLEDRQRLEIMWNENYNATRTISGKTSEGKEILSKIPVGFSQSKFFGLPKNGKRLPLRLSNTQRNGVAITALRSILLGYGVGLGKTLTDIFAIAQMVELGISKLPLIVVPNNVYWKWKKEIQGETTENDEWFQGALQHFPQVRDLYNLNNKIIKKIKTYTEREKAILKRVDLAFIQLKELSPKFTETEVPNAIFDKNAYGEQAKKMYDELLKRYRKIWTAISSTMSHLGEEEREKETRKLMQKEGFFKKKNNKIIVLSLTETFARDYKKFLKTEEEFQITTLGKVKPVPEGTISMVTYEGLAKIGIKESHIVIDKLYNILTQGDSVGDDREAAAIYERMKELAMGSFDKSKIDIDALGTDSIHIDEVHMAKNIFDSVRGEIKYDFEKDETGEILYDKFGQPIRIPQTKEDGSVKREVSFYQLSGSTSRRALLVYMIIHYLQEKNSNVGVVGLSATPFSNSPLEVYSMLSLINHAQLEKAGFTGLKDFFDTFMKIEYEIVIKPDNTIEKDVVLRGYHNLPQFRQIIFDIIDYKTNEQAGTNKPLEVVYPNREHGLSSKMAMNKLQEAFMKDIELYLADEQHEEEVLTDKMLKDYKELLPKGFIESLPLQKRVREYVDIPANAKGIVVMKSIAKMKQVALSPLYYLLREIGLKLDHVYPLRAKSNTEKILKPELLVSTSPKMEYIFSCVKSVLDHNRAHNQPLSGQIIYSTWGVAMFPILADYLADPKNGFGLTRNEIGIITGDTNTTQKENIKTKFNTGKIKVLFGSKTIQVGVDLQKNTSVLYMLDYDWNPTDDEQVRGRHARQGNRHNWVRTVYPMLENSIDPIIFQYLSEKAARLLEIWDINSDTNIADLSSIDHDRMKDEMITDPWKRAEIEILREQEKFEDEIVFLRNQLEEVGNGPILWNDLKKSTPDFYKVAEFVLGYKMETLESNLKADFERRKAKAQESIKNWQGKLMEARRKGRKDTVIANAKAELEKFKNKLTGLEQDYTTEKEILQKQLEYTQQLLQKPVEYDDDTEQAQELRKFGMSVERFLKNLSPEDLQRSRELANNKDKYHLYASRYRVNMDAYNSFKRKVLVRTGYSIDELPAIKQRLKEDLNQLEAKKEAIENTRFERAERITIEMLTSKESWKTAKERVEEFTKTNHLLKPDHPKKAKMVLLEGGKAPASYSKDKEEARQRARARTRTYQLKAKAKNKQKIAA